MKNYIFIFLITFSSPFFASEEETDLEKILERHDNITEQSLSLFNKSIESVRESAAYAAKAHNELDDDNHSANEAATDLEKGLSENRAERETLDSAHAAEIEKDERFYNCIDCIDRCNAAICCFGGVNLFKACDPRENKEETRRRGCLCRRRRTK